MAKKKSSTATPSKSDAIRAVISAQPTATLKEIKAKLEAKGVKASDALVNKIEYGRKGLGKKPPRAPNGHGSKADAIRGMFAELGLNARPRDIIAELKKRGTTVTSAQVSMLRAKTPNGGGRMSATGAVSLEHLLAAKELAERLGGINQARQALDSSAKLLER